MIQLICDNGLDRKTPVSHFLHGQCESQRNVKY